MSSKYSLNIYPRAQADLDEILRYISEELCNPSAANEPRVLNEPDSISKKTLDSMDKAVANFKEGTVSEPIDLSDFE